MVKVVFCQKVLYVYFGTMYLSAVLKKAGHNVELVLNMNPIKVAADAVKLNPDILAFSSLVATGELEWAVEVAKHYRKLGGNAIVVLGGVQPTLFPEETMENEIVDVLCRGEMEHYFVEFANAVAQKKDYSKICGLWVRNGKQIYKNEIAPLPQDLDSLPFPDRDIYEKYGYFDSPDSIDILTGRGCPFNCSFCYNHVFRKLYCGKGKYVRQRSVDSVIAELEEIKAKYNPKSINFADDLFVLNNKWLHNFLNRYKAKIGLPFTCCVRADTLSDYDAAKIKDAGGWRVGIGLESGNEQIRNNILKKGISNEQLIKAAKIIKRNGLSILTTNMVGLPSETVKNVFETIELNQKMRVDFVWCSIFQPYPKLSLTDELIKQKGIGEGTFNKTYFKGSLLNTPEIKQITNLHKIFYFAFKFPWAKPIFKQIIKLPPNPIFDLAFIASIGWLHVTYYNKRFMPTLRWGLKNLGLLYDK